MNFKKLLCVVLCIAMILSTMGTVAFADEATPVAKVGNTEYATIDEAIANWTNGTTLTLLSDVTLSDVIKLSSTEHHILDLGTYTMTAASGKDAIQYVVNGRTSADVALDIKADTTNPGGITATGKTIVSHIKPSSGAPDKDRPITRFYGGVFNASYVVKQGGNGLFLPGAGYTGASAPYFQFYGGEYNGTIYTNRSQNQFHGGTFNGSMQMSVDTSAYTLIAGGTFKNLSNSMGSTLNSDKFTIGSAKGANNGSVCIDEDGNYVITTTTPTVAEASVASNYNSNNYFYYSTVNTNGMYYEDVYMALDKNKSAQVTVYTDEIDLTNSNFAGTIVVPEGEEITIIVKEGTKPAWSVAADAASVTYADDEGNVLEEGEDGTFVESAPAETNTDVIVEGVGAEIAPVDGVSNSYEITLAEGETWTDGDSVTMTFPAVEGAADGDSAYVIHEHEGGNYIYVGEVVNGSVTITNTVGFSTFTVYEGGLTEALAAATAGDTITLLSEINISGDVVLPEGIIFNGNGKEINLAAGAVLTFNDGSVINGASIKDGGTTATTAFVKYYGTINFHGTNSIIPTDTSEIGGPFHLVVNEDATLLINRFVLGYDRAITVKGTIEDAHTFDPTGKTPSLKFNSSSGVSIGGDKTGNLTVENAYVELGNSSWKYAQGTYNWNFKNSYVSATSFGDNKDPYVDDAAWNITFDDSVVAAKNYIKAAKNVTYSLTNNTNATTGSILISGALNIDETSSLTVNAQQNNVVSKQDEHGDIAGALNVQGVLNIKGGSSTFDLLGGTLNVDGGKVNGSTIGINMTEGSALKVSADGAVATKNIVGVGSVEIDAAGMSEGAVATISGDASGFTGEISVINNSGLTAEVDESGNIVFVKAVSYVAQIGEKTYTDFAEALAAVKDGDTLTLLDNVTIDYDWERRSHIPASITIDGGEHTITFNCSVNDGFNYYSAFHFTKEATVKNLTVDMTNATGWDKKIRAISTTSNLTVDNCTFIGNGSENNTRAIIFGEGAGDNIGNLVISITNSNFNNWRRGVSDNEAGKDVKSVTLTGNTFNDAAVYVSATDTVTFTGNTVKDAYVDIRSYTEGNTLDVTATGNTLEENSDSKCNYIKAGGTVTAQDEFVLPAKPVAKIGDDTYTTLAEAFAAAKTGDTITLLDDVVVDSETYTIADGTSVTLDMNSKKITVTDSKNGTNSSANYELFYIYGEMTVTGNGTIELTSLYNRGWNAMSAIFHNRGGVLTIKNGTYKNLGGTDMAWVVDNSGNYYGDATTNIEDGTLECTYTAIRNRMEQNSHGASGTAILNISGGTISGTTSAVWAQASSTSETSPATGVINVTGGNVGIINTARSTGAVCMTTVSGGTVSGFKGEVGELTVTGGTIGNVTMMNAAGETVDFIITDEGLYIEAPAAPVVAKIGDAEYASVADALKAAQEAGIRDLTITLIGETTRESALAAEDSFNLIYSTEFDNVTIKQEDPSKVYYIDTIYTGDRTSADGKFVFDGVNIEITSQIWFECPVVLKNNSTITRYQDVKNFIYYGDVTIEPGSKFNSVIDDVFAGSITVDGGITDGTYSETPGYRTTYLDVREGHTLTLKNGAYGLFNAANEVGRLTLYGNAYVSDSKLEVYNNIIISDNGLLDIDCGSTVSAKVITGAGTISVDASSFNGTDVQVITANMSGFTGTIEITGNDNVTYEITDSGLVITSVPAVAQIGDDTYTSLQAAVDAAVNGDTIIVVDDIVLTETVTIAADDVITLDLNGKTVSMSDSSSAGAYAITNKGNLTIKDSSEEETGKITFVSSTPSSGNSYSTSTIGNAGHLVVESGTIENTTEGGASYAIDTVWYTEDVSLTIAGGTIESKKIAIRQVLYSATAQNTLNISDGTIIGGTAAAQTHNFQSDACLADVNITGGTLKGIYAYYTSYSYNNTHSSTDIEITDGTFNGAIYIFNSQAGSDATEFANISVAGGKFNDYVLIYTKDDAGAEVAIPAISGGTFATDVTDYLADGYELVENADGTYGVAEKAEEAATPFKDAPLFLAGLPDETVDGVVYHPVYMATSIDSLNYRKVGFDYIFQIFDPETGDVTFTAPYTTETSEVYSSISDATTTYTVDSIGGNGAYLFMNKLWFNAAYYHNNNTKVTITPYAIDMNGEKLTGWTFDMTNEFYKSLQPGDVKQDMFKEGN